MKNKGVTEIFKSILVVVMWSVGTWIIASFVQYLYNERVTGGQRIIIFMILYHHSLIIDRIEKLNEQ